MFTTSRFYPRTLDISSEFLLPRAYLHTNQLTQSSISENIVDAILRIDLTIKRVPLFTMCLVERFDLWPRQPVYIVTIFCEFTRNLACPDDESLVRLHLAAIFSRCPSVDICKRRDNLFAFNRPCNRPFSAVKLHVIKIHLSVTKNWQICKYVVFFFSGIDFSGDILL